MKELSLYFVYKHYTECFVHMKKCMSHKTDTRLSSAEIYTLNHVDSILRESSYAGSVSTGFLSAAFVAGVASINIHSDVGRGWTFARIFFGIAVMWNIQKLMDVGSHTAILINMPEAFQILEQGMPPGSLIRSYNESFFKEFEDELR
jgi:hypothetical protein